MVKRHAKFGVQGAELGWYGPQGGRTIQVTYWSDSTLIGALNMSGARVRWKAKNQKGWSQPIDANEFFRILDEHRRARAQRAAKARRAKSAAATRGARTQNPVKRRRAKKSASTRKTARRTTRGTPTGRQAAAGRTRKRRARTTRPSGGRRSATSARTR